MRTVSSEEVTRKTQARHPTWATAGMKGLGSLSVWAVTITRPATRALPMLELLASILVANKDCEQSGSGEGVLGPGRPQERREAQVEGRAMAENVVYKAVETKNFCTAVGDYSSTVLHLKN